MPPRYVRERTKIIRKIPLIKAGSMWRSTSSMVVCTIDRIEEGRVYAVTGVGGATSIGHRFSLTRRQFLESYRPLTSGELEELGQRAGEAEPRGADPVSPVADPPRAT